jgi:hypothetical protein
LAYFPCFPTIHAKSDAKSNVHITFHMPLESESDFLLQAQNEEWLGVLQSTRWHAAVSVCFVQAIFHPLYFLFVAWKLEMTP